ncbi:DUF2812 domain-containing protein [Sphaerisporangium fuscum]|uniref:DUF2812 domain-containing protein n=1 Tax=Sphaerisporangium fuscum TaxID=2835868 RepID=UPI001BDBD216|nr:DUF2812 domain-containing protein [Sphaerisporangium fuscum]
MSDYFDDLAALLRARGVPPERIAATVGDLAAYLGESGADPEEEFGPVAEFAARLGPEPVTPAAGAAGDTWTWTADIFADERRLNEFGEQGWEVERVDRRGMFVSRRDPEHPQRWEYRREVVPLRGRRTLLERLAPDGWEPCGTWFHYEYFKRPRAASVGPAGEVAAPPPAPGRRVFFSGRFHLLVAVLLLLCVLAVTVQAVTTGVTGGFATGAAVGVAASLAVFWFVQRRSNG